jgi:hypothetical protein
MASEPSGTLLPYSRISPLTRIRVERRLPRPGEILVRAGEPVAALQTIARCAARGGIRVVNVAHILGLDAPDLARVMVKKRGDPVQAGETIAARRGKLPFLHKPCRSPVTGRLAIISGGCVEIEGAPPAGAEWLEVPAFVNGRVASIVDTRSVTIEATGAVVAGACGVGGEGHGILQMAVQGPAEPLVLADLGAGRSDAVLVGGGSLTPETIDRAREMKVGGIIVGSISASLLDLTPPPFPVVATEGFGDQPMSPIIFDMLKRFEGHEVSLGVSAGQGTGAGPDERPLIIIPLASLATGEIPADTLSAAPARIGDHVRAVRQPLAGRVGEIVALPAEARRLPSGLSLTGAQVAFATNSLQENERRFVPWLNLERIADNIADNNQESSGIHREELGHDKR